MQNFNAAVYSGSHPEPSQISTAAFNTINDLVGLLQIISGVYLIRGIIKIRGFYKKHEMTSSINTVTMLLHAGAFGIYLIADIAYYGSNVIYGLNPSSKHAFNLYAGSSMFYVWANLVEQLLLCAIFWDLGTNEKPMIIIYEQNEAEIEYKKFS